MHRTLIENPVTGESMLVLESTAESFKAQYSLRAHSEIAQAHLHPGKEQQVTVLSGEMHLRIEGEHVIVRAGESAKVPAGARHFQWNPCGVEAVVIEDLRPAGRIHEFFSVLFGLARDGKLDAKGRPPLLVSSALFAEFGQTIQPANFGLRFLFAVLGPIALRLGCREEFKKYKISEDH